MGSQPPLRGGTSQPSPQNRVVRPLLVSQGSWSVPPAGGAHVGGVGLAEAASSEVGGSPSPCPPFSQT